MLNISVVVPFFQKQKSWVLTNFFLLPQLMQGDELIIVDDWSPDGFKFLHPLMKVVKPPKPNFHTFRLSTLRNLGIENAKNDAILIMDPDCLASPKLLENARKIFNREILYGGRIDHLQADGSVKGDPRLYKTWKLGWMIWGGLMLFSKSRTGQGGWFSEDFNGRWGAEDNDFANRCYFQGIDLKYTVLLHVIHQYHVLRQKGFSINNKLAKKKLREYEKKSFFRTMLIIVDVYGWAWDIASRELKKFIPKVNVQIINIPDLKVLIRQKKFNPRKYDIVMMYPWGYSNIVKRLSPENTIICIAGGEQLKMEDAFRRICGNFHVFGACNSKIQKVIKGWMPDKKVLVLSHGVDTYLFKPDPIAHGSFTVGWAGRVDRPLKRYHVAKQICHQLGVKLKVAGFIGNKDYYTHADMPKFYNSCDCFLVTSNAEAHPLVVYEAMSCGIPIVSTDVGDVRENIEGCGFILDESDLIRQGVKAVGKLVRDEALRIRMGAKAREIILARWTWPKITSQYVTLKKFMPAGRRT